MGTETRAGMCQRSYSRVLSKQVQLLRYAYCTPGYGCSSAPLFVLLSAGCHYSRKQGPIYPSVDQVKRSISGRLSRTTASRQAGNGMRNSLGYKFEYFWGVLL